MIKALDYYLLPLYILLATLIVVALKKKLNPDKNTYKIFYTAFFVKLAGAMLFAFINEYYYGYGDSLTYFGEARTLHNHITNDITNLKYFFTSVEGYKELYDPSLNTAHIGLYDPSSLMVIRITAFFTFFSLNTYLTTTVFFVLLSFSGMWLIFSTFISIAPGMNKSFAWGILYLPSIVFWSSGIMKDSISVAALGWLFYCFYQMFFSGERKGYYLLIILISCYLIFTIKFYILIAFGLTFIMVGIFYILFRLKPFSRRIIVAVLMFTGFCLLIFTENDLIGFISNISVDMVTGNIERMQRLYLENSSVGEGNFSIGTIDPSLSGIFKKVPLAIATVLYRPFIWEAKKIIMFFSGLENFILMLLTIFVILRVGLINFFIIIARKPLVQFCFFFTIIFSVIVGLTTFNFGTLLRYKIPCMPFYTSLLILIIYYANLKKREREKISSAKISGS